MDTDSVISYCGLVLVGFIWGVTNPFLEQGVKQQDEVKNDYSWKSFLRIITNYKFFVPFGFNQLGSLGFYYLLGQTPLTIGPIISNCSNSAFTIMTENIIKKRSFTVKTTIGLLFIFIGMYFCLS